MSEFGQSVVKSEHLQIGISQEQRELLLRGLRFLRSSVLLRVCEPSEDDCRQREQELREIEDLVEQLRGYHSTADV